MQKVEGEEKSPSSSKAKEDEGSSEQASMKDFLEQANKMLKSLTTSASATSSTTSSANEPRDEVVDRLQQQLNSLKLKVFKLSQVSFGKSQGLVDSGATHALRPLRPVEPFAGYKTVPVTLANGQQAQLRMTPGGVMVPERADAEPILPMGLLIEKLGCKIEWNSEGVCLRHPQRGILPIQVSGGCPQMARSTTLELIEELEQTATLGKVEERTFKEEVEWMKKLVETHPVLSTSSTRYKVQVSRRANFMVNFACEPKNQEANAGEDSGFTLARAWHQQGGEASALLEIDIKRGSHHDLSTEVGPYAALIRAALENKIHAIVGGPNCRSRSVLRHYKVPGQPNCPRPIRSWGGRRIWNQWTLRY